MKRKIEIDALVTVATLMRNGKSTVKESSAENGELEDHRILMTRGELIFCLRDVHRYWSTPRISYHEIEELEQQSLIQRSTNGICAIRLTEKGALVKNWQQLKAP